MSTVKVEATLDLDAVFEEIDTDDLIHELEDRAKHGDDEAAQAIGDDGISLVLCERDLVELRRAIHLADGARTMELVRRYLP